MSATMESNYQLLVERTEALVDGENDWAVNTANISVLLLNSPDNVNFAGVYCFENNELILGPFQGKPAYAHIAVGRGVCGTTAKERQTQIVKNVHEFAGHIACDSDSNSEIVISIFKRNHDLWRVFNFDPTKIANLDELDQKYLEAIPNVFKF